jgi:hypothetical protein
MGAISWESGNLDTDTDTDWETPAANATSRERERGAAKRANRENEKAARGDDLGRLERVRSGAGNQGRCRTGHTRCRSAKGGRSRSGAPALRNPWLEWVHCTERLVTHRRLGGLNRRNSLPVGRCGLRETAAVRAFTRSRGWMRSPWNYELG